MPDADPLPLDADLPKRQTPGRQTADSDPPDADLPDADLPRGRPPPVDKCAGDNASTSQNFHQQSFHFSIEFFQHELHMLRSATNKDNPKDFFSTALNYQVDQ